MNRVDHYIKNSQDFAKPILVHLRELVHQACPDVEENIRWNFPHFDYFGMLCSMAAFKQHCAFTFRHSSVMSQRLKFQENNLGSMGHLGKIRCLKDLPPDKTLSSWIKEAMNLNEISAKIPDKK